MANDMDSLESLRNRIYRLEISEKHFTERLDHLDGEMDRMQRTMNDNMRTWDRRWWIGIGIAMAGALLTGGGTLSLKSLLNFFGR